MNNVLGFLTSFVDSDHLGGWVRAGVAAGAAFLVTHYGMQYWNGDAVVTGLGTALSAVAVGLWSSLAKTVAAKPAS